MTTRKRPPPEDVAPSQADTLPPPTAPPRARDARPARADDDVPTNPRAGIRAPPPRVPPPRVSSAAATPRVPPLPPAAPPPPSPRAPAPRPRAPSGEVAAARGGQDVVTLARPPLALASGDRVAGTYTIIEHYGAGPIGHTYRARDAGGSTVAVKVVARELAPTAAERANLVAEVSKLAGRDMPRIAIPVDVGVDGDVAYVVSAWVPGRSLRRVLGAYRDAGRAMPPDEVLGVIEGAVQALRQLHAVAAHGALYPESVQIARDGRVILTDAGIAGAILRARLIEHFERYPDVFPYLSPEIRGGKPSSAGSDLYAIGALASELLTGDAGAAAAGIAGKMLKDCPAEVEDALAGLVALKPSKRAASLPLLLGALARAIGARSVPASGALPRAEARTEVTAAVPEGPSRGRARPTRDAGAVAPRPGRNERSR